MSEKFSWTVKPQETAQIPLTIADADGHEHPFWIRLKRRLTIGEERHIASAGWSGFRPPADGQKGEITVDWKEQQFTRVTTWVTAWSLEDEKGSRLPVTRDVVESLDPSVFAVIEKAISDHIKAAQEEKKAPTGDVQPPATSN